MPENPKSLTEAITIELRRWPLTGRALDVDDIAAAVAHAIHRDAPHAEPLDVREPSTR